MQIGAHESIAGGIYKSIGRAVEDGCESIQIFNKSSNQWLAKPLPKDEIEKFRNELDASQIKTALSHTSYLINIASPDQALLQKSGDALLVEYRRCEQLGITMLVMHPGSYTKSSPKEGIKNVIASVNKLFETTADYKLQLLLETTAGQGTNLGHTFEQLQTMIDGIEDKKRIGVCFDTCHSFAAGYDLRSTKTCKQVFSLFDKIIGLKMLKAFHLNDSKREFNSHKDRHELLGDGFIGKECFKYLIHEKRFEKLPGILETPSLADGTNSFKKMITYLKKL